MEHIRDKSLFLQIRDAARHEYRTPIREELRSIDDRMSKAFDAFTHSRSSEHLAELQSLWGRALYLLEQASGPAEPTATGGRMREAIAA